MKAPKQIPLKDVVFRKDNRDSIDQIKLAGLKESIIEHGVLEPILVREAKKGKYEVLCGERRVRACQLIDPDGHIPGVVMTCSDEQAEAIRLVENVQREDLTPWEEARQVARLRELEPESRLEDIAARVGKPATWVAQRVAISKLLPALRELVEKQAWPIGHITLLARLSPELQQIAHDEIRDGQKSGYGPWMHTDDKGHWVAGAPTRRNLIQLLQGYQQVLSASKWKKDDADLVPTAGACSSCPKRSSQQGLLFQEPGDDPKHDYCLDPKCWNSKQAAFVQLSIEKVKARSEQEPVYLGDPQKPAPEGIEVKSRWSFQPAKKTDKGARPAVTVNGPDAGQITYVKPLNSHGERLQESRKRVNQETGKSEGPSNSERLQKLKERRQARAVELWSAKLSTFAPGLNTVLRLAVTIGTNQRDSYRHTGIFGDDPWKKISTCPNDIKDLTSMLWDTVYPVLQSRLVVQGSIAMAIAGLMKEVELQFGELGEEEVWTNCFLEAAKEIPMPKALIKAGIEDPDLEPTK